MANMPGRVFGFGDSLVDNGNIQRQTGIPYPPSPPYWNGRFSNGRTFVEYVPGLLGLGWNDANDFAVGGATTGAAVNGYPGLPGFTAQLNRFRDKGMRFGASDLPVVWAGANDYIAPGALLDIKGTIRTAVTNIVTGVGEMYGLGARRAVVIGLPPLGAAPQFNAPSMSGVVNQVSTAHNAGLLQGLLAVNAKTGMNVYYINAEMAFSHFLANPARYGLTNTTTACINDSACATAPVEQQNHWLFYDNLHPTTGVHQLVARIIANQVSAGTGLDRPLHVSTDATDAFSRSVLSRASRRDGAAAAAPSQLAGPSAFTFASGRYTRGRRTETGDSSAYDSTIQSLSGGFGIDVNQHWRAGVAIGGDDITTSGAGVRQTGNALHVAAFVAADYQNWFGSIMAGRSNSRFKTQRLGLLPGDKINATPHGRGYTIAGETGYRIALSDNVTIAPVAGARWTNYMIDRYSERGDELLIQTVWKDQLNQTVLNAGLQLAGTWSYETTAGTLVIGPFADARIAYEPGAPEHTIRSSFRSAPGLVIRSRTPGDREAYGQLQLGVGVTLAKFISNELTLSTTVGRHGDNDRAIMDRLTIHF